MTSVLGGRDAAITGLPVREGGRGEREEGREGGREGGRKEGKK